MGRSSSASKGSAIAKTRGANPNLGSKRRNIERGTAAAKQLANPRIPAEAKDLIRRSPVYHPFPLGDGYYRKQTWYEHMRDSIIQAKAARKG